VKKLLLRLICLVLLACVLQLTLVPKLRKMKDVRRFESCFAQAPDVVMFCDSTNAWIDEKDSDPRAISDMFEDLLDETKIGHVTRAAYHVQVYAAFVDLVVARGLRPRGLVIPINLRSFSPEWDRKPAYQFEKELRLIRNADAPLRLAVDPLLRTLHLIDEAPVTQHEYKNSPVYRGERLVGVVRDFDNPSFREVTRERTRNKMILHYMYPLREDHRKLEALRNIARTAARNDLNIVFYISPIDVQTGEELLPDEFRRQVGANVAMIQQALAGHRPALIDLSAALPADAFSWHDYPNEHLCQEGRALVATRLAETFAAAGIAKRAVVKRSIEAATTKH